MHRPPGAAASTDGSQGPADQGHVDPRPLRGYAALLGTYGALAGAAGLLVRHRRAAVEPVGPFELAMLGLATAHLSRLITKDSVTSVLRAPFTTFEGAAGEGESNEEVPRGGVAHAVGELVTCPFCTGQWVATGLVLGRAVAPRMTAGVVTVSAVARLADFVQLLYGVARQQA